MINPILFAVLYLSLLNNFDEVRLFFVAETNLEFGLILSVSEHQFLVFWSADGDIAKELSLASRKSNLDKMNDKHKRNSSIQ